MMSSVLNENIKTSPLKKLTWIFDKSFVLYFVEGEKRHVIIRPPSCLYHSQEWI